VRSRSASGLQAKRLGDYFQRYFETRCKYQKIDCIRIPDGCRQLSAFKTMRVRTPFDYIIAFDKKVIFVDLKSIADKRFSFSKIERHQLVELTKLGRHAQAGYIVYFRECNEIVFYSYEILGRLQPQKSLDLEDGIRLGNVLNADIRSLFK
jgi:hypothetical protein